MSGDDDVCQKQPHAERQNVAEMLATAGPPRMLNDRVVAVPDVVDIGVGMQVAFQAVIAGTADQRIGSVPSPEDIVAA